jgi:hypothetical protein
VESPKRLTRRQWRDIAQTSILVPLFALVLWRHRESPFHLRIDAGMIAVVALLLFFKWRAWRT